MTNLEAYKKMLECVNNGIGVLTAGEIHPDIPTINDVGNREASRLKTDTPVMHAGFGVFIAKVNGYNITFTAGGAMDRADDFSWTRLATIPGQLEKMGYDLDAAKEALLDLLVGKEG